jgi:alkanesulfonate monooxygenase SsuD/methylene tetrahydromethanopterin reductase-like flavin-dependent oxidoreductase (luciferase family)
MRIGFLLDTHGGPYDQPVPDRENAAATIDAMIEEGILADRHGFHSIQVPERHGRTETYIPTPFQLMAILARETERVAIGSFATVLTLYHPMHVAEQAALIDNISRGRHYLTLARGYHSGYWDVFGVPEEKLLGRFLEGVEIIERAFRGERFSFDGKHYQVRDAVLTPQPYQRRLPIWGSGQAAPGIRRSAVYGDCWTCDDYPIRPDVWEQQVGPYREEAERRGKKPFVVLMRNAWISDSFDRAAEEFGEHYMREMRFYAGHGIMTHHPDFDHPDKITAEACRPHLVMGSREECIERLERYREELGVDYVTLRFRMPTGPSLEATREQIQRFAEEVVSYFHAKYPPIEHPAVPEQSRW